MFYIDKNTADFMITQLLIMLDITVVKKSVNNVPGSQHSLVWDFYPPLERYIPNIKKIFHSGKKSWIASKNVRF